MDLIDIILQASIFAGIFIPSSFFISKLLAKNMIESAINTYLTISKSEKNERKTEEIEEEGNEEVGELDIDTIKQQKQQIIAKIAQAKSPVELRFLKEKLKELDRLEKRIYMQQYNIQKGSRELNLADFANLIQSGDTSQLTNLALNFIQNNRQLSSFVKSLGIKNEDIPQLVNVILNFVKNKQSSTSQEQTTTTAF